VTYLHNRSLSALNVQCAELSSDDPLAGRRVSETAARPYCFPLSAFAPPLFLAYMTLTLRASCASRCVVFLFLKNRRVVVGLPLPGPLLHMHKASCVVAVLSCAFSIAPRLTKFCLVSRTQQLLSRRSVPPHRLYANEQLFCQTFQRCYEALSCSPPFQG